MSKITNLIKRTVFISGVTGALIIGGTTAANAATPPAAAISATSTAHAVLNEGPVTTKSAGDCKYILETAGYTVTTTRYALCAAASFPIPGLATRIAVCTAGMQITGVWGGIALAACTAATV